MVEETTAASHSLAQEAEQLSQLISRFKVGAESSPAPVRMGSAAAGSSRPPARLAQGLRSGGGDRTAAARQREPADEYRRGAA